jgi:TolA-binding protein
MTQNHLQEAVAKIQATLATHSAILQRIEERLDKMNGSVAEHRKRLNFSEGAIQTHLAEHTLRDKFTNRWVAPAVTGGVGGLAVFIATKIF